MKRKVVISVETFSCFLLAVMLDMVFFHLHRYFMTKYNLYDNVFLVCFDGKLCWRMFGIVL